jgi:hypothetical protein
MPLLLSVRQQPEAEPSVPDPVLMGPVVAPFPEIDPDTLELMPVVEPEHKVVVLLGTEGEPTPPVVVPGIVMGAASPTAGGIGLTPPLSSSVEPSGMAPPLSLKLKFVTAPASGDAEPLEDVSCDDEQPDIDVATSTASPPPSKVEAAPVVTPVVPEALIAGKLDGRMLQFGFGAGLNPPGLISVAANGMPVPLDPPEPNTPRGDVAPIEGLIELCP